MAETWEEIDRESELVSERLRCLGSHLYPRRIWSGLASCTCNGVSQLCLMSIKEAQTMLIVNTDGTDLDII